MRTRPRPPGSPPALAGALVGAALSAALWFAERAAFARGEDVRGVVFGDNHLLFLLSLPWSCLLWAAAVVTEVLGVRGIPFRVFFFAMPVAAGGGWGWIAGRVLGRWRRSRARRADVRAALPLR